MSFSARPLLLSLLLLAGCAAPRSFTSVQARSGGIQGVVHGGQQPVVGSSIQLYAAGTTGDGSAATPLLAAPVLTSAGGSFTLTGLYSCPSSSSLVYLVATGGDPGLDTNNPQLALMTALGPCGSLTPSTFISVNEVTTVAAVYALAPFSNSFTAIGSAPSDASALASAFLLSGIFADPASGFSPGPNVPSGYAVPVAQINTIADIISSCINSRGGTLGDGTSCGRLLSLTYPGSGPAPSDTIAALLNLANHPTLNTPSIYALAPPAAPFQPTQTTQPPDFSVQLTPSSSVTLSPLPLSFASTTVGFLEALPVQVTNNGSAAVTLNSFSIAGANPSDFTVDSQSSTCSTSLAPGLSCIEQIDFVPQAAGTRTAYLQMNSSVATETLPITGAAVAGTNAGPITLSPSPLTLVPVLGYPSTLTLTNAGNTVLNINRIVLTQGGLSSSGVPAYTKDFVETNDCGASLAPQSICTITVTEATGNTSTPTASVTVYDDASSGPQTASVNYSYCASCIVQTVGTAGTESFYYGYLGRNKSGGGGFTFGGPDAGDFLNGTYTCDPVSGGCTASYTFQPTAPGLRTATYPGLPPSTGTGTVSAYGVSGPFLSLGFYSSSLFGGTSLQLGASYTTPIYITSSGTDLQLQPPTISGPDAASFSVLAPQCKTLRANQSCTASFTATPTHVGLNMAYLVIADTTNAARQIIPLVINVSPNPPTIGTVTFPNTQPGSTSPVQNIAVSAYNNDPVTATLTSSPAGSIQFSSNQCAQTPCQLGLTFSPPASGTTYATLTVKDTVTNLSSTYSFHATSTPAPQLVVSPTSFAFASRAVNTTSIPQTFTLTSSNAVSLSLSSVTLGGTNPSDYVLTNNCPSTLAGNSSCTLSVSFAPKAPGSRSATITIVSNAPTSPDTISLTGTAN